MLAYSHTRIPFSALRSVIGAAADTVGPFRWHLPRLIAHPARLEARLVLEDIFATDALDVILPLLKHPELEVRRNIALLLGRGVRIEAHRARVTEWNGRAAVWSLVEMLGADARVSEYFGARDSTNVI